MSKNFDEKVRVQYQKRQEWIREMEERDYRGLQRARVALPVWPAHQPRRFPGETSGQKIHCSLIAQEEKEDSSCQICHRV